MSNCVTDISNLSKTLCKGGYGQILGLWLDQTNTGVSFADALLEATWTAKVQAAKTSRMYILNPQKPDMVDRTQAESVFKEGNTGRRNKIRDGYLDLSIHYEDMTDCQMENLKTLNGVDDLYAYVLTSKGFILGGKTATNLIPVPVEIFVGEPIPAENNDGAWDLIIDVRFVQTIGNFGKAIEPVLFTALNVNGLIDIELTLISGDASYEIIFFSAKKACDETEISNLSTAGNIIGRIVSTQVALTSDALVNLGNGNYSLTFTTLTEVPHTLELKTSDLAATQKIYETPAVSNAITPAA